MATEVQQDYDYAGYQDTLGQHLSNEERARLLANEYGEDDSLYRYLSQITKSYFGHSILSDIMPWVEEDDHGTITKIKPSPFTARTTRALKSLALLLFDQSEYLQNLESPKNQTKAVLWVEKLFNLIILEVDRMDTEKPEFWGILRKMEKHWWTIMTRATGWDRERKLQARKTIESIYKAGAVQPPQREQNKSTLAMIIGQ